MLKYVDEVRIFCETHKPHVLCLNETKLSNEINDEDLQIENYHTIFRKDRDRHGGGVAIYVSDTIKLKKREDLLTEIESITVELDIPFVKPILITTVYSLPDSLVEIFDKLESHLSRIDNENKESIFAGDINCNLLNSQHNDTKHMKRIYNTLGYKQFIENATRTTTDTMTLIDHLATTKPESISGKGVIPCGISDHDAIFLIRSIKIPRVKKSPLVRKVRKFKRFDNNSFLKELSMVNFNENKNVTSDPNQMWLLWNNLFLNTLDMHAPISEIRIRGNNLPYITAEMRKLIRTRDYLKKKANKTGSKYLHQAFQQIRNKVKCGIRKLRSEYYRSKIEENRGDLKAKWKILKEVTNKGNKSTDINEVLFEGEKVTDVKIIPEAFNHHFASIGGKLASEIPEPKMQSCDYLSKTDKFTSRFRFKKIHPKSVFAILSKLKNGKASGMSMIRNKILKSAKHIISESLTDIFNASLESNTFPDDLKVAGVTPIFKNGERNDLQNYRPISVLCTVARVFEKLIYQQLYDYLMGNSILNNCPWGFRSAHSTALALIDCTNNWLIGIDNGKINSTILLDVKKAFDTIDHDILLRKLSHYGISHTELEFFRSYLCNRLQCCSVSGHTSSFKTINCEVPQGSILSSLLFIIYVNDLPLCIENGHVTMYADDTSSSNGISTVEDITRNFIPDIKNVMDWLKANNLCLNVLKTEFILTGTTQNILKIGDLLAVRVQGHTVKRVYKAKYLGIVIDNKLTWKDHIDYVSLKIKRNLGIMKRVRNDIPKEAFIALYRTMVEPYLRYCNNIWGKCSATLIGKLQTLQNRAARIITNATYDNTDNAKLLRQLNWLNVPQLIDFETASLMYKIENGLVLHI